ncbi:MAG: hypothetical protein P1U63_03285 [Coxiellaceae bacterium]|nr:hypothetical protein [Coxiellaceae bacterium]
MRITPSLAKDFDYSDLPGIGSRRVKGRQSKLALKPGNSSEVGFRELFHAMRHDAINKCQLSISEIDGTPLRRIDRDYLCKEKDLRRLAKECMVAVNKELSVQLISSYPLNDAEVNADISHLVSFYNVEMVMAPSEEKKLKAIVKYCRGMLQYQPYEKGNDFIYGMLVPYLLCFQNDITLPKIKPYVIANKGINEMVTTMEVDIEKVSAFIEDSMLPHVMPCGIVDMQLMYCAQTDDSASLHRLIEGVEPSILVEAQYAAACCGHVSFIGALHTACRASGITMGIRARAYDGRTPLEGARRHDKPEVVAWLESQAVGARFFSMSRDMPKREVVIDPPAAASARIT